MRRRIRILAQRLRSIFRKDQMDAELHEELAFHFARLVEESIESGVGPAEARRRARRLMGNTAAFAEECRDQRRVGWLHDFYHDLRYGARMLRKTPGLTAVAVASLALGVGANTAILGAVDHVLFGQIALPDADRLVVIRTYPLDNPQQNNNASVPDYLAWEKQNRSFEALGASLNNQQDFGADESGASAERLAGQHVTPSLFKVLGVEPILGRVFAPDEGGVDNPVRVIVLSYRVWQRRFGGDPGILQRKVRFGGENWSVIGVMPPGFHYPHETSDYWLPLTFNRPQLQGSARYFMVTGRLKNDVTIGQAQLEMEAIASRLAQDFPSWHGGWGVRVQSLRDAWFGWTRQPLAVLEGAVILVMLIACANVATLLLARNSARRAEFAMRAALGATRGRTVRQLLAESMLLSALGGAAGLILAQFGLNALEAMTAPPGAARIGDLSLNYRVVGLTAACSILTGLMFGIAPAIAGMRSRNLAKNASARGCRQRVRGVLVAAQIGLALMLLVGSGLLIHSFVRLVGTERNFDPDGILSFDFRIPIQQYLNGVGSYRGFPASDVSPPTLVLQRIYERLRLLPGAESVAGASFPPVDSLVVPSMRIKLEGRNPDEASAAYFLVTPDLFRTMKTPLVKGRDIGSGDTAATPWVAVVNETAARRFWPGEDPIGKRLTLDALSGERSREVVGVARDVPLAYAHAQSDPVVYVSYLQQPARYYGHLANMFGQMTFLVRAKGDPLKFAASAGHAVAEIEPDRPIANVHVMNRYGGDFVRDRGRRAIVVGVFALTATLLAAIGVYGVMAYSVAQRANEIGVRLALGAGARCIAYLIGRQALLLIAAGVVLGLAGAAALMRLIASQLWGVTPTDPTTFAAVTALLTVVALCACIIPLRRALRVDPAATLRSQ